MRQVRIITDSTAYLPADVLNKYQKLLDVVPLTVIFPRTSFPDGLENMDRFLHLLRTSPVLPTTSQPAPGAFKQCFETCLDAGHDALVLTISSKLSGTFASATTAARDLGTGRIKVLDSKTTGPGLAMLVKEALLLAEQEKSLPVITEAIENLIARMRLIFCPDTLEYLRKGGRIGGAAALLGSMLQIKPLLHINQGEVSVLEKVRTRPKAIQRMLAEIDPGYHAALGIIHVAAPERAQDLLALAQQRAPQAELKIYEIGPVIAAHAGPDTVGIAFFS